MSIKEVISVYNDQLSEYLIRNGFNKPVINDGLQISNCQFPDKIISISTAPMFKNCVLYEFIIPGLDDRQSIFNYSIKYLDYSFTSIGWYQYNNVEELNLLFCYIKSIHNSWLNTIFNTEKTDDFINHINEIRRKEVNKYTLLIEEERKIARQNYKKADNEQLEKIKAYIKELSVK